MRLNLPKGRISVGLGHSAGLIRDLCDRAKPIRVVEERRTAFLHDEWFINAWTVGVSRYDVIAAVEFEEDVFVVVNVAGHLRTGI